MTRAPGSASNVPLRAMPA